MHILADLHRTVTDDTVDRCPDYREGQIPLRLVERRPKLAQDVFFLGPLGIQHRQVRLGRSEAGPGRGQICPGAVAGRTGVVEGLAAGMVLRNQFFLASEIKRRTLQLGLRGLDICRSFINRRPGRLLFNAETFDGRFLGRDLVFRRLDGKTVIAIIDPGDHITLADGLILRRFDGNDIAGDLCRQQAVIRTDIGIVGGDFEPADCPPFISGKPAAGKNRHEQHKLNDAFTEGTMAAGCTV